MTKGPNRPNIDNFLKSVPSVETPEESYKDANMYLKAIEDWSNQRPALILAALQTLPNFHANDIRFDWLQRLVLAKSMGRKKPLTKELNRALNRGLEEALVLQLEDPIEDTFCDVIVTEHGNFRIILGRWEGAAAYTQTILDAFVKLPDSSLKADAITASYALLSLSDAVCERANLFRGCDSSGDPQGDLKLGTKKYLKELSQNVQFSESELDDLGIQIGSLAPFFLKDKHYKYIAKRAIGDSPLEFHPLLRTMEGVSVLSPTNISIAIRAALISTAINLGMGTILLRLLLIEQERFSEETGFWPTGFLKLSPPNNHNIRTSVCNYDHGHYLHVVQIPTIFEGFPQQAFASFRQLPEAAQASVCADIESFWRFMEKRGDCRYSTTILLMSGWGAPHGFAPKINQNKAPENWTYLPLSIMDTVVLGACEEGGFRNVLRINEQTQRMEKDGFSFLNLNGFLNLFSCWRDSDGNIIPEHMSEMSPPCELIIPQDGIRKPRMEALNKQDRRALPLLCGTHKVVQRMIFEEEQNKQIYASVGDVKQSIMLGAVTFDNFTVWIKSEQQTGVPHEWNFQLWNAILQWINETGTKILRQYPKFFSNNVFEITLMIPKDDGVFSGVNIEKPSTPLAETVSFSVDENQKNKVTIFIKSDWKAYLTLSENDAEVQLITTIYHSMINTELVNLSRDEIRDLVQGAIGSKAWRWLHAREYYQVVPRLGGQGLFERFVPLPLSAHAFVKYGAVWTFKSRDAEHEIKGKEACHAFLKEYRDSLTQSLIADIRRFNRHSIVIKAANAFQSARYEQYLWRSTIRAQREIRGKAADDIVLKKQNQINAILRASKSICEIAACEGSIDGTQKPSRRELEDLFAKALLLFGNGQIFAAIRGELIKAELKISPCGDVLSDRSILAKILEPSASWLNRRVLNQADKDYDQTKISEKINNKADNPLPWSNDFKTAIEAEYCCSSEAFFDFQFAVLQIAEERQESTFVMTHSDLKKEIGKNSAYPYDIIELLKRLTLKSRSTWQVELTENDIDLSKFDRSHSLINKPLLALNDEEDPEVLIIPAFISDAIFYAVSGLENGSLGNNFWNSIEARRFSGKRGNEIGHDFEDRVSNKIQQLGLMTRPRCKISTLLNKKVSDELGDIDVFALSSDKKIAWVIEAKDLNLCRTEGEVASRLSEYRGRLKVNSKGREKPDKLLRHLKRVEYLRANVNALQKTLKLSIEPKICGLLVVDAPQPMNFHMLEKVPDAKSVYLDVIDEFNFEVSD